LLQSSGISGEDSAGPAGVGVSPFKRARVRRHGKVAGKIKGSFHGSLESRGFECRMEFGDGPLLTNTIG